MAARVHLGGVEPGVVTVRQGARMGRRLERLDAPKGSVFEGYWDLIEGNGLAIGEQAPEYRDREPLPQSAHSRGPASNLRVEGGADVEHHVTFDARLGPVVVEKGASVESFSRVMGPCYIGRRTKVLSALVGGGTSVFEGCKVGGQLENTIVMPNTNKAHHGYVGDSYVGEWVNLGAGSTFSNLKNTYGTVRVRVGAKERDTGMTKLGPFLGDMAKVSIGALVYSGRSIGPGSLVSGLVSEDVPSFTYHDGSSEGVELLLESVIETQRRMMERRDKELSRAQEKLIRRVFTLTAAERRKAGVRKGRIG